MVYFRTFSERSIYSCFVCNFSICIFICIFVSFGNNGGSFMISISAVLLNRPPCTVDDIDARLRLQ